MSNMLPKISGKTDEVFTPKYAINPLLPYLNHNWKILECAIGEGHLARALTENGFHVIGNPAYNFLIDPLLDCDCIVTNPPYSKKTKFLKKCFESGKPFALLLPLTALEGKERSILYRNNKIEIIIPDRRIDFIMTEPVRKSSSWFQVAWFTHGLNLPKQLLFVELIGKVTEFRQGEQKEPFDPCGEKCENCPDNCNVNYNQMDDYVEENPLLNPNGHPDKLCNTKGGERE